MASDKLEARTEDQRWIVMTRVTDARSEPPATVGMMRDEPTSASPISTVKGTGLMKQPTRRRHARVSACS